MLKDKINALPKVLQKQFYVRSIISVLMLILFAVILIVTKEFVMGLPCLVLALYLFINVCMLIYKSGKQKILTLTGECTAVEKLSLLKGVRNVWIMVDGKLVKMVAKGRFKRIYEGDTVSIHLYNEAKMYDEGDHWTVCDYLAIEHVKQA